MSHDAPIHFSHKRHSERLGGTQGINDEWLGLIADCQTLERSGRHLGDGADKVARLTSDENPVNAGVSSHRLRHAGQARQRHGQFGLVVVLIGELTGKVLLVRGHVKVAVAAKVEQNGL